MTVEIKKDTQFVTLRDKRKLCFAEWGDFEGITVFMFNGFPNSRFDGELVHQDAKKIGLHVFSIDRPEILNQIKEK